MAVASVPYSFAPLTDILSSEANANFQALVSFINSELIQKDASVAFTAVPSGPALDPTGDNQLARKRYVDRKMHVGTFNATPGALGNLTVTHGSPFTPTRVFVQPSSPQGGAEIFGQAIVDTIGATTFRVRCLQNTGSAVTVAVIGFYVCYP